MNAKIILIFSVLMFAILSGCIEYTNTKKISNGVVIESNTITGDGTITNTNNFSVIVKCIWIAPHGGETTIWIEELAPE